MNSTLPPPAQRRRNRLWLLAIVAVFLLPILAALVINRSGQRPAPTRQHGELLQPPQDLGAVTPRLVGGADYPWNPQARLWRIVVTPPAACDVACASLAADLDLVWRLLGHNADRVHVLWAGSWPSTAGTPATLHLLQPDPRLHAALPRNDAGAAGPPVYVIDPNGFVILRYPPGFDPAGLRSDLARLVKLK